MTSISQSSPRRVCLLKNTGRSDKYESCFREAGFDVASLSPLRFAFVNQGALREKLRSIDSFAGIVVTSPRSCEAVGRLLSNAGSSDAIEDEVGWDKVWESTLYCVGPATQEAARHTGFRNPTCFAGFNSASKLAEKLVTMEFVKPLLILAADRRRPEMSDTFQKHSVAFEELTTYETKLNDVIGSHVEESFGGERFDCPRHWLAFFSPSGVECSLKHLCDGSNGGTSVSASGSSSQCSSSASRQDEARVSSSTAKTSTLTQNVNEHSASASASWIEWSQVSFAAIGKTTANALRDAGWGPHAVAKEPTPAALLGAIDACSKGAQA